MTYLDLFDIQPPTYRPAISRGDIVSLGDYAGPLYQVIAVRGGKAWVRNPSHGSDSIVSVDLCRRVGPTSADTLQ